MQQNEPIPEPFDSRPRTPKAPGGCGKPLLVGCGIVAVLLIVALVVLVLKTSDLLAWSLGETREVVAERLPPELTAGERERLESAFDAAIAAVEEGSLRAEALPELQAVLLEILGGREALSRGQVARLVEALEAVAGIEAEPIERPPPPPPGPEAVSVQAA